MQLQKQPSSYTCLITAFAMVIDIPVAKLIKEIGHDGSQILWPEVEGDAKYRAHIAQEVQDWCYKNQMFICTIDALPAMVQPTGNPFPREIWTREIACDRLEMYMCRFNGVLVGQSGFGGHAVAWEASTSKIFDPRGEIRDAMGDLAIEKLHIVHKINS